MKQFVALLVILFAAFLVYSPHILHPGPYMVPSEGRLSNEPLGDYPYPLHGDGWNHVAQTKFLIEHEEYKNVDPQRSFYGFSSNRNRTYAIEYPHFSFQKGYHSFLAGLVQVLGVPIDSLAPFIPALIFLITGIFVYLFFELIFKSSEGGLFAVLLLAFLPSTTYLLGFWFIVPLSMTLFLLCFSFLVDFSFTPKGLIPVLLLLLVSWFVYPIATLLILSYFILEVFFKYKKAIKQWWRKKYSKVYVLGVVSALIVIFFIFLDKFLFTQSWASTKRIIVILQILPLLVLLCGVGGLIFLYKEKKSIRLFFYLFILYLTFFYFLYPLIKFTLFFPYQRLLMIGSWFIVLFASLFLAKGLNYFILFLKKNNLLLFKSISKTKTVFVVLILFAIIAFSLPSYYQADPLMNSVQKVVDEDQLKLLYLIDSDKGPVFADSFFSQTVYSLSGLPVIDVASANLGGSDTFAYTDLFDASCEELNKTFLNSYTVHIITDEELNCNFLTELGFSGDYKLYRTDYWHILI